MTSWRELDRAIEAEGGVTPCQNSPDLFFNIDTGDTSQYRMARELCGECPIREICLSYALDNAESFGVWGGLAPRERRNMLRGRWVA